jgi:hypothetical protein
MTTTTKRRADELKDGDVITLRASSISRTATGYVMVWLDGKLQTVPPDTLFSVVCRKTSGLSAAIR